MSAGGPEPGSEERQLWLRQRLIWLRARTAESRVERDTLLSSPLGQVLAEFGAGQALDALYPRLWEQIHYKEQELHEIYPPTPLAPPHQPPSPSPPQAPHRAAPRDTKVAVTPSLRAPSAS